MSKGNDLINELKSYLDSKGFFDTKVINYSEFTSRHTEISKLGLAIYHEGLDFMTNKAIKTIEKRNEVFSNHIINPDDLGCTGHGDISYSDADPGL